MLKRLPSRNRPTLTATQPSTQPRNLEVLKSETASRAWTAPPTLSQKKQRQSRPPLAQPRHGGFLPSRRLGAPLTGVLHGSGSGYPGFKHVGMYVHTYLLLYIYIHIQYTHREDSGPTRLIDCVFRVPLFRVSGLSGRGRACNDPQLALGALGGAQAQQPRGCFRQEDQLACLASSLSASFMCQGL